MIELSVVMVTCDRAHLLRRSLARYAAQTLEKERFELVVVDDDSQDDTEALCKEYADRLNLVYIKVWKPAGVEWRDCAANFNLGIRATRGKLVIGTHPEVIPGNRTMEALLKVQAPMSYVAAKIYYLTQQDQAQLDTVPWATEGALAVRQLPGFYQAPSAELRGHPDYTHTATDKHTRWESFVFGGMDRATWRYFGGFHEFTVWGSIDVDFMNRRNILRIKNNTLLDPDTICVHQNHDTGLRVPTPRNMELCMQTLPVYRTAQEARLGYLW